jgi:hypothetical protein
MACPRTLWRNAPGRFPGRVRVRHAAPDRHRVRTPPPADPQKTSGLSELAYYIAYVPEHYVCSLAAYAPPAVASAPAKAAHPRPALPDEVNQQAPADCGMTALTVPEIQRLLTAATAWRIPTNQDIEFHLAWSDWRRRHQARAPWHHYRTRLALTA